MKMLNKFVPILLLTLLLVSNVSCVAAVDNGSQTNHITSDNVNHIESPDTLEQIYIIHLNQKFLKCWKS